MLNSVPRIEEDLNRLKRVDPVYTTCEAGKRRSVNHTRALARLAGSGPGRGRGRGRGRGEARRGRMGGAVRCTCAAGRDVTCRCDVMAILQLTAINRAMRRGAVRCDGYFAVDSN